MKYIVDMKLSCYFMVEVEAKNEHEACKRADEALWNHDFGDKVEDIEIVSTDVSEK